MITFDDMMDVLADVQRRKLLIALLKNNPPVVIAGSEAEDDDAKRLVAMDHVHLPKLADYGVIDWDRESNEVHKGPNFDEIRPLLELLDDHEDELPDDWL